MMAKTLLLFAFVTAAQMCLAQDEPDTLDQKMGMFKVRITCHHAHCLVETELGAQKDTVYNNMDDQTLRVWKFHHVEIYNDTILVLLYELEYGLIYYNLNKWDGFRWKSIFKETVAVNSYRTNHAAHVEVLDYNKLKVFSYFGKPVSVVGYEKALQDSIQARGASINAETMKKEQERRQSEPLRFKVELVEYNLATKTEKRIEIKE